MPRNVPQRRAARGVMMSVHVATQFVGAGPCQALADGPRPAFAGRPRLQHGSIAGGLRGRDGLKRDPMVRTLDADELRAIAGAVE